LDTFKASGITMEQQDSEDLLLIEAYGDDGFRIRGRRVEGSILIVGNVFFPIETRDVTLLTEADFDKLLNEADVPEILLVGTGERMALLPPPIRKFLQEKNLPAELMDTGAAARTFNVLRMEERRVAALLLAVK